MNPPSDQLRAATQLLSSHAQCSAAGPSGEAGVGLAAYALWTVEGDLDEHMILDAQQQKALEAAYAGLEEQLFLDPRLIDFSTMTQVNVGTGKTRSLVRHAFPYPHIWAGIAEGVAEIFGLYDQMALGESQRRRMGEFLYVSQYGSTGVRLCEVDWNEMQVFSWVAYVMMLYVYVYVIVYVIVYVYGCYYTFYFIRGFFLIRYVFFFNLLCFA